MAIEITKENFQQEVLESTESVLLDFWATWCGPCQMIAPILEQIATENPDIKVCKINVDEQQELAIRYGIMSIPTIFAVKDGQIVNKAIGLRSKEQLLELLK